MLWDFTIVNIEKSQSALLKDYLAIKYKHPNCVVLFQVGEFYETFFQDAKIFSDITGCSVGARKIKEIGDIAQAGIKKDSLEIYLKKLLGENIKVCLCDEYIDKKGIRRRKLVRKYTQGTILENELLSSDENNFIAAIFSDRKNGFLAYADVSTGQFFKTKCDFSQLIDEVEKICPNELLVLENQKDIFKDLCKKFNATYLPIRKINKNEIENLILDYCAENQKEFLVTLGDVVEYEIAKFLAMDNLTRKNLELTRTKRFSKKKGSIIWFINHTKTPMGARLLKKYINEPLKDVEEISLRQNAVKEIIDANLCDILAKILEEFCDLSRICAKISNKTIKPKDLYTIICNSENLQKLNKMCQKFSSQLLKINKAELSRAIELAEKIKEAINPDTPYDTKQGGFISDGYDTSLDYLRLKLNCAENKIQKYIQKQKEELNIPKLKLNYSKITSYTIEIPPNQESKIPSYYNKVQALSGCIRYKTQELKAFEQVILKLKYQILELEIALYDEIKDDVSLFTQTIRALAQEIAIIDVLNSFAKCALDNNLTLPKFNKEGFNIKNGYHPSLLDIGSEIIKNDTKLQNGELIVLTGANMSGKSTYLKHNAIISLLSQIGSYVPAQSANLTVTDKIIVRQGSNDDILNNNSSFMVEMDDLKTVLDSSTNKSLVILDEPAKSTNSKEGGAIARAFCEYLIKHNKPKTIIATHNFDLTKLEAQYPDRVFNYMTIEEKDGTISKKIKKGVAKTSQAINTARLANLPDEIIEKALDYLED